MFPYEIVHVVLIELIVNILRTVVIKQAVEIFMTKKDIQTKTVQFAYGLYCFATSIAYCAWKVSFLYEFCNFIGILGLTFCYDDTWKKRLWTTVTLFCIDLSCLLVAVFSFQGNVFGIQLFLKKAAGVILFLISITAISHISDSDDFRQAIFDKRQAFLLLVTPVVSLIVLFSTLYIKSRYNKVPVIVSGCMLMINLSIFYLYHEMLKSYRHLQERERYRQQKELYQNQMEVILESQNRVRSLRHDMKNHILALQAVIRNGREEEVQEYLQKMQEFMINPAEYVMTGNEQIDSILNYKIRRAKELLNVVETKITIPEKLNLYSFDLNVILGNLLDNALEAAVQTEEKQLAIQMSMDRGVLFFNIRNSYQEKASEEKRIGNTAKGFRQHHGIGMKNVRAIVEKYHGDMEITCVNGYFEVDIIIYEKDL